MGSEPQTLPEALEEIQRLQALGDRLAGALELLTGDMHEAVGARRAARYENRYYICLIENPGQLEALAEPVSEWIIGRGMDVEDLRREKQSVAAKVARAR